MKTYQVFDSDGRVVGSVTAESIADACKKSREGYCDFPTLVEMPEETSISIQKVIEEKTSLEIYLTSVLMEQIEKFEKRTGVPVAQINTSLNNLFDICPPVQVGIELDFNNIK